MFGAFSFAALTPGSPVGLLLGIIATRATLLTASGQASSLLTGSSDEVILRGR